MLGLRRTNASQLALHGDRLARAVSTVCGIHHDFGEGPVGHSVRVRHDVVEAHGRTGETLGLDVGYVRHTVGDARVPALGSVVVRWRSRR